MNAPNGTYKYLARKPKSHYKHLFVNHNGRYISARTIYGCFMGEDAMTPEEIATDRELPVEAVLEAIAYCQSDPPEILEDWRREEDRIQARMKSKAQPSPDGLPHPAETLTP